MSDLLQTARPAAPVTPRTRQMPARFLWPDDVVLIQGRQRLLTLVEVTCDTITIHGGAIYEGGPVVLAPDAVVEVVITAPPPAARPPQSALRVVR